MYRQPPSNELASRSLLPSTAQTSPILTDPDMILPYSRQADAMRQSHPHSERQYHPAAALDYGARADEIGTAHSLQVDAEDFLYGNGTMLSDIGEVTEVESTPTRKPFVRSPTKSSKLYALPRVDTKVNNELGFAASPVAGYDAVLKRSRTGNHQRQVSVESTSTVRSEPQSAEILDDFDDGVSVDDSNFQGDDEESIADSTYDTQMAEAQAAMTTRRDGAPNDDTPSSALSRRAEEILANAKKRLNTMEGNLSRARSSFALTPSSSLNSLASSDRSPSSASHVRRNQSSLGIYPTRLQYPITTASEHTRAPSDDTALSNGSRSVSVPLVARPVSAVGGGNLIPLRLVQDHLEDDGSQRSSRSSPQVTDPFRARFPTSPRTSNARAANGEDLRGVHKSSDTDLAQSYSTSPATDFSARESVTRPASSMQMRDISDKLRDLKSKVSKLRDTADEDKLRRRSLQSLRSASPFSGPEDWDKCVPRRNGPHRIAPGHKLNPWNGSETGDEDEAEHQKVDHQKAQRMKSFPPMREEDIHPVFRANGSSDTSIESQAVHQESRNLENEAIANMPVPLEGFLDDYNSESDVSVYHSTVETPLSHEDREDAFDYEHFFLHSAMGTISQHQFKRRGSSGSFESEDSVETARAHSPVQASSRGLAEARTARGHVRSESTDSVSTMDTFATAIEAYASPDRMMQGDEEEEDRYFTERHAAPKANVLSPVREEDAETAGPTAITFYDLAESPSKAGGAIRSTNVSVKTPRSLDFDSPQSSPNSSSAQSISNSSTSQASTIGKSRAAANSHRPSVSSFASSTGTTRSFPLVNKPKTIDGGLSPSPSFRPSPDRPSSSGSVGLRDVGSIMCQPLSVRPQTSSGLRREMAGTTLVQRSMLPSTHPASSNGITENRAPSRSPTSASTPTSNTKHASDVRGKISHADRFDADNISIINGHVELDDGGISTVATLNEEDQVLVERLVAALGRAVLGLQDAGTVGDEVGCRVWRGRLEAARRILEGGVGPSGA